MDSSAAPAPTANEMRLIDVPVTDENVALNVLVSFLNVAQKRGSFSIAESAKIFECIQKFVQQTSGSGSGMSSDAVVSESSDM